MKTRKLVETIDGRKVYAFKCPVCGNYVEDEECNWNIVGVFRRELLCYHCHLMNMPIVAINGLSVFAIAKPTTDMLKRGDKVNDDLFVMAVQKLREKCVLRWLNYTAQLEGNPFNKVPREDMNAYLIFSKSKFYGYLCWNYHNSKPTLRQLFIVQSDRRKGYGSKLIKYFVSKHCNPNDKVLFLLESPNQATTNLVFKLNLQNKVRWFMAG
jgi:hypothetical protein